MPEVYDIRGVLAPEDFTQDCGPWLWWVDPTGLRCAADARLSPVHDGEKSAAFDSQPFRSAPAALSA
jgi:hypothetical protein